MRKNKPNIFIVDDNKSFRNAVNLFLVNELNCQIIGEAADGNEFLTLINGMNPDIVLMDIHMPDLDGITATKRWCLVHPQTKVIAVTMFTEKAYLLQLIEAGFKGCVFKTNFFSEIGLAIEHVNNGGIYFEKELPIS